MLPKLHTVCITFQRGWLMLTRYKTTRNYVYYCIPHYVKLHQLQELWGANLFAGVWCTVCRLGPGMPLLWPVQGWMEVQAYKNPSPGLPFGKVRVRIPHSLLVCDLLMKMTWNDGTRLNLFCFTFPTRWGSNVVCWMWDKNWLILSQESNSGASAREARQRSTMGKKNW